MKHNQIEEDEIDLGKLFSHLRKNIFPIFFITLLITLLTAGYAYFIKPVYSSDVSIAFSDEKTSQMSAIIPDAFTQFGGQTEKELETVKLTLETRKFINSAIKNLKIEQRYYIEHHFRKNELYQFENLKITLQIHDDEYQLKTKETLYNKLFKITPIDERQFLLTVDEIDYKKVFAFNETIREEFFTISILKIGKLENTNYYISRTDKNLLADNILKNMQTTILSDNVMKVVYRDTEPKRAKEIVEEIAKKFMAANLKKKTSELKKTLGFLDTQIIEIEQILKGEGKNLKDYQKQSESFFPIESNVELFNNITKKKEAVENLKIQLTELKNFKEALVQNQFNTVALLNSGVNITSLQSLIELFQKDEIELNEMNLQENNIEKSITKNLQLSQLIERFIARKSLLRELTFNFTDGHPQVIQAKEEITQLKDDIQSYIQTNKKRLEDNLYSTKEKIRHNIVMVENNINNKLNMLDQNIEKNHQLLKTLPEKDLTIQELKRKFALSENIYTFLLQKKMETKISLASIIANTQIIENARLALRATKPNKKLIVIVGFIVGLILAIFYTLLKSMLDRKIRDEATVKELTNAPLYGSLPDKREKRFFEEALRSIRTNLQFIIPKDKSCTTILLSSTIPGEGKTTVITGLAKVIAQTGKKVLLMDLDLRKPRLYQELGKSNKRGMTQYLVSDMELLPSIQEVNENLDFFPAGAVPPNPSEMLMSEKFETTMKELLTMYDYILFDTAPIGSVIDANMLLPYSDIVLLVVRANIAERGFLENFNNLRKEKNIKSSGIILNQVKRNKSDNYGYGYGYGYGIED